MLAAALDRALALINDATAEANMPGHARDDARAHALMLFAACGASSDSVALVALGYAAELLGAIAVETVERPSEVRRLIGRIEKLAGVPRVALGREVLQTRRLLELPVDGAIEVSLSLLLAFTGAGSVAVWTPGVAGELELASRAGDFEPDSRCSRDAARALLQSAPRRPPSSQSTLAVRIERLRSPPAALVVERIDAGAAGNLLLAAATTPVLSALLDRETLLAREQAKEEATANAVQRRLARVRFDLHDGPQQDVHLLAQDLERFREQLRPMIAGDPNATRLLGRLDDLDAMLETLDRDLRRLSTSARSPFLTPGSLPDALAQLTDAFAARTGLKPQTRISGSLSELTDSQQITLLALTREALSNIRKHSQAGHVTITISSGRHGVRAEVTDDGIGFDPQTTLAQADQAGRLGLVGMHARVRMLGGRTQIDSRPGGPTVISAILPPWPPDEREPY